MSEFPRGPQISFSGVAGRPSQDTLSGNSVQLTAPRPAEDAGPLWLATHGTDADPGQWTYMSFGPFDSSEAMREWMAGLVITPTTIPLCIRSRQNDVAVGMASYMNVVPEHGSLELGSIWYTPAVRRTHTHTEAMYLMLCEAFDRLGFRRVEWKCDALNQRSRRSATRLGFSYEGLFRQHFVIKGRNRDTAWFAMLDRDWPTIKRHFEQVLYDSTCRTSLRTLNQPLTAPDPEQRD